MDERLPLLTIKDFLYDEFMEPLGISAYKLAKDIHVPVSRIQDILHDRRKISIDTSMRLGKYFGMHPLFFFRLQLDLDYRKAVRETEEELETIEQINADPNKFLNVTEKLQSELDDIVPLNIEK